MRLILAGIFCLFCQQSIAQSVLEQSDRVYNVYRRDSSTIIGYNKEFAHTLKKKDSITINDNITAHAKLSFLNKPCLGDVYLYVDILFEAKNNRAKITFSAPRYTAAEGGCALSGTLKELIDCRHCDISADYIKNEYLAYIRLVYETYHDFLKQKSKDGNW